MANPWLKPVTISQAHQHTKLAAACYFLLGSGILAPWNALITGADYFEEIFPVRPHLPAQQLPGA
jgi:hypothetical protein